MTVTAEQIAAWYGQRRLAAGPDLARMQEVQQMFDGHVVVALPELNRNERNFVPNRLRNGVTQLSQRVASELPNIICPPVRPGIDASRNRALDRRRALFGWWERSRMPIVMRERARHLLGYASSPVEIRWDTRLEIPMWSQENPLYSYPAYVRHPQDLRPGDCIFETTQTLGWIIDHYPQQAAILAKPDSALDGNGQLKRDARFTLLRYIDDTECVQIVLGQREQNTTPAPGSMIVELERYENRAGQCPVVNPRQISLSRIHSQFDDMSGMYQMEAKLSALAVIATEKGVMGDYWIESNPNEVGEIIQAPERDGTVGIVKGGRLQRIGVDPQFQTNITIDRLAESQQLQAGLSSEMSGVAPTNVRTGVRAQNLLANVIDFPIQEGQELFQESLQEENKIAIAFARAYGNQPKTFYVEWDKARGDVTYDPQTTFETDRNIVRYPMVGADQAGLVISGGQRVQMGTLSHRSFMDIDPLVKDPEREHDQIIAERLEQAVLAALEQQATTGQLPAVYAAKIAAWVASDEKELFAAIDDAHREAQAEQAQQAPPGAPETQPGLQGPPQAQGQPAAPPDLATALSQLRRPQTGVTPQEVMAG